MNNLVSITTPQLDTYDSGKNMRRIRFAPCRMACGSRRMAVVSADWPGYCQMWGNWV